MSSPCLQLNKKKNLGAERHQRLGEAEEGEKENG